METVLTVADAARILRSLEGRFALSPRAIRYYARIGMVVPSGRMRKGKTARATRLYTAVDVGLLRLVCRLHRQRVHERALWGLLVYRGDELRRLLEDGSGTVVVETPAALAITSDDATAPRPIRVEVSALMAGLDQRLTTYRESHPKIWTGLAWIDAARAAELVLA